jgi:cytosine deaminase
MATTLLRRAVTPVITDDGARHDTIDVRLDGQRITDVGDLTPHLGEDVVELGGYVLLPAAIEPHAHLDKAFLAERVENPTGDLIGAIDAMKASADSIDSADIISRAERAARLLAHNGFVAVRTHADTTLHNGLRSVEALAEVRRSVADVIDVEIVALADWPISGPAGADRRALLVDALAVGADLVGGCPHLEPDIESATDALLQIATDNGRGVDLHTDETLDPGATGLLALADRVLGGFEQAATASHCVSLGQQPSDEQRATAEKVAEAGVGVVALPHTNLFLQGRDRTPMPRALTAVGALRAAGATVAAGADNLQDPFNPVGRACPFETAGLMIMTSHLLPVDAWSAVSSEAARVVGCEAAAVAPGSTADLVAVRAHTVREAIAFGPDDRIVWRRGVRAS